MKRILLFFAAICFCLMVNAQLDKEAMTAYIDDVKAYERAIANIVKEDRVEEGIAGLTALINRSEKKKDYSPKELASYYSARGHGRFRLKRYQQAAEDDRQALALLQKAGETGKADMCTVLYQLAIVYFNWEKRDEAMAAADDCVNVTLDHYGPLHSETMSAYSLRSNIAGFYNKKRMALDDRQQVFCIIQQNIERNFVYLTSSERSAYWNKYLPETTQMFTFAHLMDERQSSFTDALFNQQLLAKGLLLTAESALQRAIDSDAALSVAYQRIRQLKKKASDAKTSALDAETATLEADRLERQLSTSANSVHRFLDFLIIHADDIRSKLRQTDVAIEFVDYRVGKDSTIYAALVLSPRWEHVRFIPLVEEKEIAAHSGNLVSLVWQPVIDALDFTPQNVYFAPTGLLYQLPIESHTLADNNPIGEAYNFYRVSSTRWLAFTGDTTQGKDAVIYGGLAYGTNVEEMQRDAARYANNRIVATTTQRLRAAIQDEYPYLPGTKSEAESIARVINQTAKSGFHAETLLASQGSEASFKSLDGQFKRIIHIATHGIYQEDDAADKQSLDNALDRSALLFAGADNKLQGKQLPHGVDDGVLTAQEISLLDLRGLELVALSACETGQGHITSDGVFGLQRGFKKAGANSVLMSLWKVDDQATCLLMTEFYKNWIGKKMTKHDALEKAKQTVRSHKEKGWDKSEYWAAFIFLDGLD